MRVRRLPCLAGLLLGVVLLAAVRRLPLRKPRGPGRSRAKLAEVTIDVVVDPQDELEVDLMAEPNNRWSESAPCWLPAEELFWPLSWGYSEDYELQEEWSPWSLCSGSCGSGQQRTQPCSYTCIASKSCACDLPPSWCRGQGPLGLPQ
ncbi:isthmin-2-like isoform X2 [Bos indicus x Bos taurus]|uniref:isthmin-2-like isoform X2 n=1 Tax=Bos indicus x Bos taurus TaxID=30522 RepID=UPI000F7D5A19|nr:isthmin-2-like isoform X2 [Bos indicus x Bos taurus]XP_027408336.1 isthmin-2-like isoform X2 [Bos indicus x Bos taurus]